MATIKSFTSLKQSKVLAKILPIESADMFWYRDAVTTEVSPRIMNSMQIPELQSMYYSPCWSLAALLNVINQVKEIKYQRVTMLVGRIAGQHWYVELLRVQDEKSVLLEHSKELVDACVAMIEKFNEQNLL